jgi:PAS domain S-box-containing protein
MSDRLPSQSGTSSTEATTANGQAAPVSAPLPEGTTPIQDALREKEQLQQLCDSMPQFVWMSNAQGELQYVNRQWVEYSGLTVEQSQNPENIAAIYHPDEVQAAFQQWMTALATQQSYEFEGRLRAADGAYRWFLIRIVPVLNEQGQVLRWYGTATDIHDRKIAELNEQFLRDLDRRLRQLTDSSAMEWEVVRSLGEYLQVDRCLWHTVDLEAGITTVEQDWYQPSDLKSTTGIYQLSEYILPDMIYHYCMGQPLVIEDVTTHIFTASVAPNFAQHKIRAILGVPCIAAGRWVAALAVNACTVRQWRPDEVELLQEIVARLWLLIEQTRAIAALREQEERTRLATEAAELGMWFWDLAADQLDCTDRCKALFGLSPNAEFSYPVFLNALHPEDRDRTHAAVTRALAERVEYDIEYRTVWTDGSTHWIAAKGRGFYDGSGQPVRMMGTVQDITSRKRSEQALQENEQRFVTLAQASPVVIFQFNAASECIYINSRWSELTGHSEADALGIGWVETLHPDDRDRLIQEWLHWAQNAHQQDIYQNEGRIVRLDGSIFWYYIQALPLIEAGSITGYIGTPTDINDRKQTELALQESEARFRTLADNIPQLAWIADENGWIFWYNQRWFDYTGTTLAEMQGWGWRSVHHPDYVERVTELFRRHLERVEPFEDTFPLRGQDGQYRWFLTRAIPIQDEQGNVLRWFGTNTDITERQQSELEREQLLVREQAARREAERVNRLKDEFFSALSHELRTPLNPILGWTKLLQGQKLPAEKVTQALETIERNVKHQIALVNDLLDVSRVIQGKFQLSSQPVDLALILTNAIQTVQFAAQAKLIDLKFDTSQPVYTMGDRDRLGQIFWNLLSNAIKFTPEGGQVTIELSVSRDGSGQSCQIRITDTGIGIAPDFLPHVFEYFRQAEGGSTRRYGGLGLGLAIVRHLVELHGGTVTAESPGLGQGATFTVKLPLLQDGNRFGTTNLSNQTVNVANNSSIEAVSSASPTEGKPASGSLANVRILLVDDEPDNLELLRFLLNEEGAIVSGFTSPSAALQSLTQSPPDLLISDIGMPEMDGYELIQQVRLFEASQRESLPPQQGGQVRAIALTAFAQRADQKRATDAGYQAYIAKPVDPAQVITTITQILS